MNLTHHPFLGEVEWAEGGQDVCAGDTGSCGNTGECPRSPVVHTAGPEVSPGRGRAWPQEDGDLKQLLEHSAGLAVLELTGPGRDLVI